MQFQQFQPQYQPQPVFAAPMQMPINYSKYQIPQQDVDEFRYEDPLNKRIGYLRKLYSMLFLQMIIIGIFITAVLKAQKFANFFENHQYLFYIAISIALVTGLIVLFLRKVVSEFPLNWILFLMFTISLAVLCSYGVIASNLMLLVYIMTTCIILSQLIYTFTTRKHLTYQEASLFILIFLLLSFLIFLIFSQIPLDFMIFIALAEIVFAFYFIYDTQSVISGAKDDFDDEDCISGAILLYVDIVILLFKFCELVRNLLISYTNY